MNHYRPRPINLDGLNRIHIREPLMNWWTILACVFLAASFYGAYLVATEVGHAITKIIDFT